MGDNGWKLAQGNLTGNASAGSFEINPILNHSLNILSIFSLLVTMVSLGCTMDISEIKKHILKPKGVLIALMAQFCIMPVTAFGLAKILQMDPIKAVTVLVCGCCPGGTLSNIFAMALKGDMNLSIVMTTCSSIVALGMMPLLLYIFSQGFHGLENAVPYVGISTGLALILIPCSAGILINYYRPNYARKVTKVRPIKSLLPKLTVIFDLQKIWFMLTFFVYLIWMIVMPDALAAAGLMSSYKLAFPCYTTHYKCKNVPPCRSCRTISMETGCQNILLCVAVLKVAFPPEDIGAMFLFPLIYITFQCAEALLLTLFFRCYLTYKTLAEGK
uniref:Solute carrier family 10 member 1 n=1 Tax=Neogobius melanostomus TaxID=47308 RepID=A0A8C6WMD2_9GOBI